MSMRRCRGTVAASLSLLGGAAEAIHFLMQSPQLTKVVGAANSHLFNCD